MTTIDLTKGAEINFTGRFEETKTGVIETLDKNNSNQRKDLTGAAVRFTYGARKTQGDAFTINADGDLAYDLTAFNRMTVNYEVLIEIEGFKFKYWGEINFS